MENRISIISPSGNSSIDLTGSKHVLGLSSPVWGAGQGAGQPAVFATELGSRGPALYRLGGAAVELRATWTGGIWHLWRNET